MTWDSSLFYANAPEKLLGAQTLLEAHIRDFAEKSDKLADLTQKYREKRAECVIKAKSEGLPVTIILDIVKGQTAPEKADCLKAETAKKVCQYNIAAMNERIYSIRHLCKDIDRRIQTGSS